jgi:hypothetical protein
MHIPVNLMAYVPMILRYQLSLKKYAKILREENYFFRNIFIYDTFHSVIINALNQYPTCVSRRIIYFGYTLPIL